MKFQAVTVIIMFGKAFLASAIHTNSFDVIRGCKQYEEVKNYNDPLDYYPTTSLQYVGRTNDSTYFKIAIQGRNNGIIRFGESLYPYSKSVVEIAIGGYGNTKSTGRRQHRTASNNLTNNDLAVIQTPNLMSHNRPTMFRIELFVDGTIEVTIDGQKHPFLSFTDSKKTPFNYLAFCKWEKDLLVFYDCPLESSNTAC